MKSYADLAPVWRRMNVEARPVPPALIPYPEEIEAHPPAGLPRLHEGLRGARTHLAPRGRGGAPWAPDPDSVSGGGRGAASGRPAPSARWPARAPCAFGAARARRRAARGWTPCPQPAGHEPPGGVPWGRGKPPRLTRGSRAFVASQERARVAEPGGLCAQVAAMPMPEDFAAWTASILCNDCNQARCPEHSGFSRGKPECRAQHFRPST